MQNTPFDVIQGDTWSVDIEYTDEEGNPINISNYNIVAEVRDKPGGSILCAEINSTNGISLNNFLYHLRRLIFSIYYQEFYFLRSYHSQRKIILKCRHNLKGYYVPSQIPF